MLIQLSVHNYAIVEYLDLELQPGMSVITGETGAGKSIMLDALSLTLGARADSSVVRPGADKADISSNFDISRIAEARQWLQVHDMENDDQCLLRRVITREGRSRAYINSMPCTQSDLKELGALLIDIHNQHEHQSLLKNATHRRLLDEYAGLGALAEQVADLASQWRDKHAALKRLSTDSHEQQARLHLLTYQLEELEALSLGENELQALEQEQQTLAQAEQLIEHCRFITDICSEGENTTVLAALNSCLSRSRAFKSRPQALEQCDELLTSAQIQIEEAVAELSRFLDNIECDPERQSQVEGRLDSIYSLARKHRIQPHALNSLQQQLSHELESLQGDDNQIEGLQQQLEALSLAYQMQAEQLSAARTEAAKQLANAVTERMQALGMPGGHFSVQLQPLEQQRLPIHGLETIEFLVRVNPGQPLKPLAKVASGGELSRISLAIQVITAQTSRVPTLVFDEVDVGIGGPTAEIVGKLLRQLGESGQVITVTHLPQVAAQGHQHLFVHKARSADATHTTICTLDAEQRIEEIARMLGGVELTDESRAHARQMLTRHQL